MAMFGHQAARALSDAPDPSLGAVLLNAVGRNVLGVDYLGMKRRQADAEQTRQMLAQLPGLIGGQAQAAQAAPVPVPMQGPGEDGAPVSGPLPPPAPPPAPSGPNWAGLAAAAPIYKARGFDLAGTIEALKAGQPHMVATSDGGYVNDRDASIANRHFANRANVNGTIADLNDPQNTNRVISEAPVKGAMPVYDNLGRVVDWKMPQGALGALAGSSEATQAGQTRGTMLRVPLQGGGERLMMGRDYMSPGGQGGAGGPASGVGTSQTPADAAYATEGAKTAATQYKAIADTGAQANAKIAGFRQIDRLLGNFEGGKLAPTGLDLASAANSIGFRMDPKMQNAQAADAISKQLVLSLSGGSLGTGFSNADRTFMEAQVPSLLQSAGGRRQLVSIGIATAQRQQDVAQKARAWQDRFGRIDSPDVHGKHFQDYLDAWSDAHPVFAPRQ